MLSSSSTLLVSSSAGSTHLHPYATSSKFQAKVIGTILRLENLPLHNPYSIADVQGRVILQGWTERKEMSLSMEQPGAYFVQVGNSTRLVIPR